MICSLLPDSPIRARSHRVSPCSQMLSLPAQTAWLKAGMILSDLIWTLVQTGSIQEGCRGDVIMMPNARKCSTVWKEKEPCRHSKERGIALKDYLKSK